MTTPALTPRQRKAQARAQARQNRHQRAVHAAAEQARREDARQEAIAPSVRRRPILTASGEVFKHPALETAGQGFVHSNPLRHLLGRQDTDPSPNAPTLTILHVAAAERLSVAWHNGGETVSTGVSSYGDVRGGDGSATAAMVLRQAVCHAEVHAARMFLGSTWHCVCSVTLYGLTITAWAGSVRMDRKVALGFLIAGLDRLVEFYAKADRTTTGGSRRVRVAQFSPLHGGGP